MFGLRDEREIGDITKTTQNCKDHRICAQKLKIEDGELGLHDNNDGIKGGYFLPFTVNNVLQPKAELDITGSELAVKAIWELNLHRVSQIDPVCQVVRRLDQLLRGRVEKFPGHAVEGDILPRFIFNGQEQFIEFPVNNVTEWVVFGE